jgi:hypothetical protein
MNAWIVRPLTAKDKVIEECEGKSMSPWSAHCRLKADFQNSDWQRLAQNWYRIPGSDRVLKLLILFVTTCRCKAGITTVVGIKMKARNRLNLSHDLISTLVATKPRISKLVKQKQYQPSH